MFDPLNLVSKENEFAYVKDAVLWGNIWKKPYPLLEENNIVKLDEYFTIEVLEFIFPGEYIPTKRTLIKPTQGYLNARSEVRDSAF